MSIKFHKKSKMIYFCIVAQASKPLPKMPAGRWFHRFFLNYHSKFLCFNFKYLFYMKKGIDIPLLCYYNRKL